MEKYAPAMQETKVQSLGVEHPLEEEMATHSSIPAWRIHRTESLEYFSSWGAGPEHRQTERRVAVEV